MFTVMRSIFSDKNEQERIFLETTGLGNDLEWTIVRPGGLGLGSPTGEARYLITLRALTVAHVPFQRNVKRCTASVVYSVACCFACAVFSNFDH